MQVWGEAFDDVCRYVGRLHAAVRQLRDTRDLPACRRDAFTVRRDRALVTDSAARELGDGDAGLELLFETQRPVILAGRRNARPADGGVPRVDAQSGGAPERVL